MPTIFLELKTTEGRTYTRPFTAIWKKSVIIFQDAASVPVCFFFHLVHTILSVIFKIPVHLFFQRCLNSTRSSKDFPFECFSPFFRCSHKRPLPILPLLHFSSSSPFICKFQALAVLCPLTERDSGCEGRRSCIVKVVRQQTQTEVFFKLI